jgi:hypothetical protein
MHKNKKSKIRKDFFIFEKLTLQLKERFLAFIFFPSSEDITIDFLPLITSR